MCRKEQKFKGVSDERIYGPEILEIVFNFFTKLLEKFLKLKFNLNLK